MAPTMQSKSKSTPEQCVNDLILKDRYDEAIVLAKKELKRLPPLPFGVGEWVKDYSRHWFLAHICSAYYEKRDYKTALKWGRKAFKVNPHCPVVLWYYAGPLARLGKVKEAIKCYKAIYDRGSRELAYGMCGEGMADALQLRSDVRIRLAICYYSIDDLKNALKWGKLFLRYFSAGGIEKLEFGEKLVERYQKELANEQRKSKRREQQKVK